jgi:Tfp pilus assembly protein PilO
MEQLTRYRIPILTGVGTLVVVLIVFMAWISPQGSKLSSLHAKETQLQSQQSHLQVELFTLRRDKAHMAANCAALTTDLTKIPGTPTVDDFFHQVSNLAVSSGDPNTPSISVTQSQASAAGVKVVTVSLNLTGTYGQMTSFLRGLDGFPRLFTISSIAINGGNVAVGGSTPSANTGGYTLTLQGSIYYAEGQTNVCAPANPASSAS